MSTKEGPVFIEGDMGVTFQYTSGVGGEAFCRGMKDGKFVGSRCPQCRFVYLPARSFCEECFVEVGDERDVGPDGTIYSFTRVDGQWVGAILLEGASSLFFHRLKPRKRDPEIGDRVRAVFVARNRRRGSVNDVEHFEVRE